MTRDASIPDDTAVTFDLGQTLVELDAELLAQRVTEHAGELDATRVPTALATAWASYDESKRAGEAHERAWTTFMRSLLVAAGVRSPAAGGAEWLERTVAALWQRQPHENLWRRPIAGMFELVADLVRIGVPLGIVSNSEGRVAELVEELGIAHHFVVIADSGKLGTEKPQPEIFHHAARALGVPTHGLIHVGDAWEADVLGILGVGGRAVWFSPERNRSLPDGVLHADGAAAARRALAAFGIPAQHQGALGRG